MPNIYLLNGCLSFNGKNLASIDDYESADRCVGSIFEALEPGELVKLADGEFKLSSDLDLEIV